MLVLPTHSSSQSVEQGLLPSRRSRSVCLSRRQKSLLGSLIAAGSILTLGGPFIVPSSPEILASASNLCEAAGGHFSGLGMEDSFTPIPRAIRSFFDALGIGHRMLGLYTLPSIVVFGCDSVGLVQDRQKVHSLIGVPAHEQIHIEMIKFERKPLRNVDFTHDHNKTTMVYDMDFGNAQFIMESGDRFVLSPNASVTYKVENPCSDIDKTIIEYDLNDMTIHSSSGWPVESQVKRAYLQLLLTYFDLSLSGKRKEISTAENAQMMADLLNGMDLSQVDARTIERVSKVSTMFNCGLPV